MTFKEFWKEEKRKGIRSKTIESEKHGILETLRKQGFSDQQINKMKMKKILRLMWEALERQTMTTKSTMSEFVKKAEITFSSLRTFLQNKENWKLLQTDRGLRKDLFELAAGMDDLERVLFDTEEIARRGLDELKKKLQEKEKRRKENSS